MDVQTLKLEGAALLTTKRLGDSRGAFSRLFCQDDLASVHHGRPVQQANWSRTQKKGTVRGLHFQYPPKAEDKIVRCLCGEIFDVMVDLRAGSPTFLQWHGEVLTAENMYALYIPKGFAHGFQTLVDHCELLYLHSEFYSPMAEDGLHSQSSAMGIEWPMAITHISERDEGLQVVSDINQFQGIAL